MQKFVLFLFALLLFEPIVIDEATFNQILQAAHSGMRGPEYDMTANLFNQLEQRAVAAKQQQQEPEKK